MPQTRRGTVFGPGFPPIVHAWVGLSLAAFFASGCHREEIASYEAPKDRPVAASPAGHAGMSGRLPEAMPSRPGMKWKELPAGWTSKGASGMRVANFSVTGPNNAQGDLAVIPLPGTGGSDVDLVNLWRGQLGLAPIEVSALPSHTDETSVGGQPIRLFNIVGSGSGDAAAAGNQILVAALRKDGFTWFFKLGGDAATVAANRDPLKAFLAGVEFTAPEPMAAPVDMAAAAPSSSGNEGGGSMPKPKWQVPETWKAQTAPQMVHSKWTVSADAGATADVTVSVFPGETGGLTANLNRWRSQVGLPPAPEAELTAMKDNLDVLGGKGTLVDFTGSSPESGNETRIVAAVVRRDGFSWFYKLLGAPAAVGAHREAFVQLVQSAQYLRGS
ncbi:MAG: hypothetical protein JNL97_11775 [Verrucomicrobiales bacterium]|nr:hypothetical protein [Verrucomicrobiales bacterium]